MPIESEKTLNVIKNPFIKEIISFLRFLYSPIDDLSFASFVLGEIFTRVTQVSQDEITNFIFKTHKAKGHENPISLYRLFRREYAVIWDRFINDFFRNVGFISPYELIISVYQRFEVLSNFKGSQAFFMKFLELIKNKEEEYVGLGEFLSYLDDALEDDLYVNVAESDSVKILTIHKAKGLEFPVVIIPFLRMDISPATGGKGTNSYVVAESGRDLGLVRITKHHCAYSPGLLEIYIQNYKKACIDELNNIYVALTRAQFELYAFIPKKSGSSNNKVSFLIPYETYEKGAKQMYGEKGGKHQTLINISPSTYKDCMELIKDEFGEASTIINRGKVLKGNLLHAALSQIGNCVNLDIEIILEQALEYAQSQFLFVPDAAACGEIIKKLLSNQEFKSIFFIPEGTVICEMEVVNKFGNLKKIDRLILNGKEVKVVDYKTSKEKFNDHIKQVEEYMSIVKDIYPARRVKGFLIYLDEMSLEEVNI